MKNLAKGNIREHYTEYAEVSKERRFYSYKNNYEIGLAQERLFYLKIQAIIEELSQIMVFIRELGKLGFENSRILEQINTILYRLRSGDRNYKYVKIIHILAKYLNGIRDFTSSTDSKGAIFYKKLFESTIVAIMKEIQVLDDPY